MGSRLMEDIKNQIEESVKKIKEIENLKDIYICDYSKEKREFFKIVRGDFLTGGIIASSLFLILNSLINFFGINFPFNLLIGIFLGIIGITILIVPVAKPKFTVSKFNNRILKIISDLQERISQKTLFIKYDFIRLYRKYLFDISINSVKEFNTLLNTFQDKLLNTYKDGVEGLDQLKKHSSESMHKKVSKINQKFTKIFKEVHSSAIRSQFSRQYIYIKSIKGEKFEREEFRKTLIELHKRYRKHEKIFELKLRIFELKLRKGAI